MELSGLSLHTRPIKKRGWSFAKNIVVSKTLKAISNEDGFSNDFTHPQNYKNNGVIETANGKVLFYTNNTLGEIWVDFGNGVPQLVIKDNPSFPIFNFNTNNPIEGSFKYNFKKELIISWWEGLNNTANEPRILNLSNIPFPLTPSKEFSNINQSNLIKLFPDCKAPNFSLRKEYKNTGNIQVGSYWFVASYEVSEYDRLNWLFPSQPFPIGTIKREGSYLNTLNGNTFQIENYWQITKDGDVTNKSYQVRMTNVDTRFKYINIAIIHESNKVKRSYIIKRIPITGSTIDFIFDGSFKEELPIEEVLVDNTTYKKIQTGTFNNDRLVLGNSISKSRLKYQKFANNIEVTWELRDLEDPALDAGVLGVDTTYKRYSYYGKTQTAFRYRTPIPEEVYAIYINLVLNDGTITEGYHIPGRAVADHTITGTQFLENATIADVKAIHPSQVTVEEEGIDDDVRIYHTRDTSKNITGTGGKFKTGYWENLDEQYPNLDDYNGTIDYNGNPIVGGRDLRNTNVLHHRMPDIKSIYEGTLAPNMTKIITLNFNNIVIPNDIADQIQGFIITYAEKGYDNMLVLGSSPVIRERNYAQALNDPSVGSNPDVKTDMYARLYDNALLALKPQVKPRYLKTTHHSTTVNEDYNTGVSTITSETFQNNLFPIVTSSLKLISDAEYIMEDNAATAPIANNGREEYLRVTFRYPGNYNPVNDYSGLKIDTTQYASDPLYNLDNLDVIRFMFAAANIMAFARNLHTAFWEQKLVSGSNHMTIINGANTYSTQASNFNGFITGYNIRNNIYCPIGSDLDPCISYWDSPIDYMSASSPQPNTFQTYLLATAAAYTFRYPCYSIFNYVFNRGNEYNHIPTIADALSCNHFSLIFQPPNKISIDTDYDLSFSSVTNFKIPDAYNPFDIFTNELPYRVHRSVVTQSEEKRESWRIFLVNDYYDMPKDKGEVWKLISYAKTLVICQLYTTHIAQIKDKIATELQEIYLGTGDLFDRPPTDVLENKVGYVGCSSKWGTIITKHGVIIVDQEQGKVFLFNGSLKELSNNNVKNWFEDNLPLQDNKPFFDNPFNRSGIFSVFDDKYNRLLITKRKFDTVVINHKIEYVYNPLKSFTVSYSFDYDFWVCFHDYVPHIGYSNRKGVYFIDNNTSKHFKANAPTIKGQYLTNTIHPSYVDIIFGDDDFNSENLQSTSWLTEVIDSTTKQVYRDKTFTHILLYNDIQCTGLITLDDRTLFFGNNNRGVVGHWNFNHIRDCVINANSPIFDNWMTVIISNINQNKSWFKKAYFLGKFVNIRYIYDNLDQHNIHLFNATINAIKENR